MPTASSVPATMSPPPLWQAAASLAARAHQHQLRKDSFTPYAAHPTRVALTIALVFGVTDEVTIAAALLHDVIEDCDCDFDEVEDVAGREVAEIVAAMSKDMRLPEDVREPAYDRQLAEGPWQARLVKLADVYDNYTDAAARSDAARAKVREKAERALALVQGEERLAGAAKIVRQLIG